MNGVFAGHTALQAASQNGHEDVVRVLIRYEVDLEMEVRGTWVRSLWDGWMMDRVGWSGVGWSGVGWGVKRGSE